MVPTKLDEVSTADMVSVAIGLVFITMRLRVVSEIRDQVCSIVGERQTIGIDKTDAKIIGYRGILVYACWCFWDGLAT